MPLKKWMLGEKGIFDWDWQVRADEGDLVYNWFMFIIWISVI